MNQKGVIYIILSAILLYLYYRKRDLAIFAGFAVVVVGTLILGKGGKEGLDMGGGGGIDKECAKMGFKQPKIDKNDINGSLEKAMKNIEKVAETKWPFEKGDIEGKRTEDKTFDANWRVISDSTFMKDLVKKIGEDLNAKKVNKEYDAIMALWGPTEELYKAFIIQKKTDKEKTEIVEKHKANLDNIITSGPIVIELINNLKKSDEIKEADDGVKDILKYITCIVKQWIAIFNAIKKAMADAGGGKKKNKKKTKKKPVDEDEDDGEDEKPKKKKKKKSADEDDGEDEKPKKKKKKKSADEDE
jgi:hypothetical protein